MRTTLALVLVVMFLASACFTALAEGPNYEHLKPIESLARKSLVSYPMVSCTSIKKRRDMVLKACRDYHIDGALMHSNKSCVPITLGQMDMKRALEEELDVPSVIIDGDHMDANNFSVAQFQTRADAFMEMLLEKKGRI